MILPVIMAGGSGTRLWPLSRAMYPKQFINIVGDNTMLQDTVLRLENIESSNPLVICNNEHRFLVAEQMHQMGSCGDIILEPVGRNTAPAIALAALSSKPEEILLILPSDHLIKDMDIYNECIEAACKLAMKDKLVTFGIKAKYPEVGFGYIREVVHCLN